MTAETRLEQVGAQRIGNDFGERRRFLARGGEAVQVYDGVWGFAGIVEPAKTLFRAGYQAMPGRSLSFTFSQPAFEIIWYDDIRNR